MHLQAVLWGTNNVWFWEESERSCEKAVCVGSAVTCRATAVKFVKPSWSKAFRISSKKEVVVWSCADAPWTIAPYRTSKKSQLTNEGSAMLARRQWQRKGCKPVNSQSTFNEVSAPSLSDGSSPQTALRPVNQRSCCLFEDKGGRGECAFADHIEAPSRQVFDYAKRVVVKRLQP